ncbi:lycopene cyclase domain-containing protein [Formosa sp. A9]|uniref:lycopene cyclase domain-containing protein n=1 Tax=Formosa sp. A9 TaxID=3442641 RepID=UPI003EBC2EE0
MKCFTYLLVNLACIAVPLIASFYPKHAFYKRWLSFIKSIVLVTFFFLVWDYYFTEIGVWGFNPDYLLGIYLGNLPLEEVLFFVCIPFSCVFSYFAFQYLIPAEKLKMKKLRYVTIFMIVTLILLAVFNYNKWYTVTAFGFTAVYLAYLLARRTELSRHYVTYAFIFPFFLLSNGLLTGSFLDAPIVWYNNAENLGLRLFTIPVEDSIYGLLLIFMNIEGFKYFEAKQR